MQKLPKLLTKVWTIIVAVFLCCACSASSDRYVYTAEERLTGTGTGAASCFYSPGIESNVYLASAIFVGNVESEPEEVLYPAGEISIGRMEYTVSVEDIWYGECEEKITVSASSGSGVSNPRKGDKAVFFLTRTVLSEYDDKLVYKTVNDPESILIINPPSDRLFSLSTLENMTAYDGKTPETLQKDIEKILQDMANGKMEALFCGEILQTYLEEYGVK